MASISSEKVKEVVFKTEEDLAVSLAKYTADLSEKSAKERGVFTVVLSGGGLIKSLRKLIKAPYIDSVDWKRWHVFWVDDRLVPKDNENSNYKLAYDLFLSKVPIPCDHIYAINGTLSAEDAAEDYEMRIKQLVKTKVVDVLAATGFPRFDLMLLGMGIDGHVASLFPGHPQTHEKKLWVTFDKHPAQCPYLERVTLTFPVINSSAYIALVVNGSSISEVIDGVPRTNTGLLPVEMISLKDGEFTWFLDNSAASKP